MDLNTVNDHLDDQTLEETHCRIDSQSSKPTSNIAIEKETINTQFNTYLLLKFVLLNITIPIVLILI